MCDVIAAKAVIPAISRTFRPVIFKIGLKGHYCLLLVILAIAGTSPAGSRINRAVAGS